MSENYKKMVESARKLFLGYDSEAIIKKFDLEHTEDYLFVRFMGVMYSINRKNGTVDLKNGSLCNNTSIAMIIYDMLCYSKVRPSLCGRWTTIESLHGVVGSTIKTTDLLAKYMQRFDGKTDKLAKACEALNGVKSAGGDLCYEIEIFDFFDILFKFWNSDDEFQPQMQFFFDENALQFMHYETLWYVIMVVSDRINELL